jgi:hypothetical protein
MIKESTEFADMQLGQAGNPLGTGYGFAKDPTMSVYSDDSAPYVDNYTRMAQVVKELDRVANNMGSAVSDTLRSKLDFFLEDIDEYKNLKILRIFPNDLMNVDIYLSFVFMDEEFFGVFKNFNGINKPKFESDLFSDPRYGYINKEYYIKINNYFYKIIYNWFIPTPGTYMVINDTLKVKDSLGNNFNIKKNANIYVKGYNTDQDNEAYLIIKFKDDIYKITKNDYFYFKYWTKKLD